MNVVLFNLQQPTNVFYRNFGCYKLASEIRRAGITCQVVEFLHFMSPQDFESVLTKFIINNPDAKIVGVSTTFMASSYFYKSGNFIKSRLLRILELCAERGIKLVFGGANALKIKSLDPAFDKAKCQYFIGYADTAFIEYCKAVVIDGKNPAIIGGINNFDTKAANYDFASIQMEYGDNDFIFPNEALLLEISRGCIFRCKFCAYPLNGKTKNDHIKCEDVLREELLDNYNRFGTTKYVIVDDTYNDSIEKMQMVANVVQSLPFKDEVEFAAFVRFDLIASNFDAQLDLIKKINLKYMFFGIETLNDESGRLIGKGMPIKKTIDNLRRLRAEYDCYVSIGLIIGFPTDNLEVFRENYETIISERLADNITTLPLGIDHEMPFRSEFSLKAEEYGYQVDGFSWTNDRNDPRVANSVLARELATKFDDQAKAEFGLNRWSNSHIFYIKAMFNILGRQVNKEALEKTGSSPTVADIDASYRVVYLKYMAKLLR